MHEHDLPFRCPGETNAHATQRRWKANERGTILAAVLATSMAFVDATALNVAMPALRQEFRASGGDVLWTINAYGVVVTSLILLGGILGDRIGRRRVCAAGVIVFSMASLACGLSQSIEIMIISRAVQGVGAALMIPASLAIITAGVAPERRGQAIGIWSALSVVTTALGPILGGLLVGAGMWRGVFWINLPLALLALVAMRRWVVETQDPNPPPRIDFAGAAVATITLGALNYGLIQAATTGFQNFPVLAAIMTGLVSTALFCVVEYHSSHPLLPLSLFRDRTIRAVCGVTVLIYSGLYGMMFFLALNLIDVQRYDPARAGLAQLPLMLFVILLSGWAGGVYDRHGPRRLLIGGTLMAAIGFAGLALPGVTSGPREYWWSYLPSLLILGTAMGLTIAPLSSTLMSAVSVRHAGLASGINSTTSRLSSVLGLAILGPLALVVFHRSVEGRIQSAPLDSTQRAQIVAHADQFTPNVHHSGLSVEQATFLQPSLERAFVDAFRAVAIVCSVSAIVATLIVFLRIGKHPYAQGASP